MKSLNKIKINFLFHGYSFYYVAFLQLIVQYAEVLYARAFITAPGTRQS